MRPNVLLLILDAARRDALEPYGAPAGSTPAISQLAGRGTALPGVYATSSWTVPSHASIFTGLMPRAAGLGNARSPAPVKPLIEAQRSRLLPEVMRRHGYATQAASANLWISAESGFDAGFDDFVHADTGRNASIHLNARRERLRWLRETAAARVDDGAAQVETTIRRWMSKPRQPFFLFVNLLECHSPYLPPYPYGDVSRLDRMRAAEDARRYYRLDAVWRVCSGLMTVPDSTLERARRLYKASIRYMDDWIVRVLERLDGAGVLDETLVIVASDHGENLGEGGLIAHSLSLDNRLIHVPLVMAGPGVDGRDITSLAELPRLVAEAVGIEEHPWIDGPPRGVGVAQLDPPVEAGDREAAEKAERMGMGEALETLTTPLTCAVAGGLKLLRRGDREELYDLDADPLETEPQPAEGRDDELAALREALAHPAVASQRAAGPSPASAETASADELRQLEERMKLLGYM